MLTQLQLTVVRGFFCVALDQEKKKGKEKAAAEWDRYDPWVNVLKDTRAKTYPIFYHKTNHIARTNVTSQSHVFLVWLLHTDTLLLPCI